MPAVAAVAAVLVVAVLVVRNQSTSETVATRPGSTSLPTVPPNIGSLLAPLFGSVPGLNGLLSGSGSGGTSGAAGAAGGTAAGGSAAGGGSSAPTSAGGGAAGGSPANTGGNGPPAPGSESSGQASGGTEGGQLPQSVIDTICNLVRTAGLAPLHRGDPAFSPYLDPDGNGLACE